MENTDLDTGSASGDGGGKKKPSKSLIIGAAASVVIMITAIVLIMSLTSPDKPKQVEYKPTAEDAEQLKYEAEEREKMNRRADSIRDQSFIPRGGSSGADASTLIRELERTSLTPQASNDQPLSRVDDKDIKREEEAISYLLRQPPPQPTPPTPQNTVTAPPPPETQSNSATGASGTASTMFAYSKTFGGAKYVEKPIQAEPAKPAEPQIDDLTKLAFGMVASMSHEGTDVEDRTPAQTVEKKTQLFYSGLPPVVVHESEMLEAVLVNRLLVDTEPSPVVCTLSRDLYDKSGQYVVFPANSRVIGTSQAVSYKGASRLFISFHRIILPNGMSVDLPQSQKFMKAMDATGAQGIVSHVNHHWFLQFGAAVMLGVIDGIAGYAQRDSSMTTADGYVISRTSENFDRVLDRVMAQYSSVVPTIRVDQGKTLRIYISDDMIVSPYARLSDRSYYGTRP